MGAAMTPVEREKLVLSPLGVVIRLVLVMIVVEILINLGIATAVLTMPGTQTTDPFWVAISVTALIVIKAPVLYLLVFRPMQMQQTLLVQRNDALQGALEKWHQEEALRLQRERQELANRERMIQIEKLSALGTMVGGVAHEINNPLMGIMNYVEYARDKASDATSKEVLGNALHEIDRIKSLVANMLVFVRVDGAPQQHCLAHSSVQQTLTLLAGELKKHAVQVDVDLPPDLPALQCSAASLQQVLVNVLLNARDAITGQSQPHIHISARQAGAKVILSICDNGPGIADPIREKIFDPFFTTKPVGKGTGLGLSVSRHLMQEAGGSISTDNLPGGGCCFRLTFNLA
jgi:C4-dicarboxylate-specific signal transduction histidine kinase